MAKNDLTKIGVPDFGTEVKRLQSKSAAFILTTKGVLYVSTYDEIMFFPSERIKFFESTGKYEKITNHVHTLLSHIINNNVSLESLDEQSENILTALMYFINLPNLASRDGNLLFKGASKIADYFVMKIKEMKDE